MRVSFGDPARAGRYRLDDRAGACRGRGIGRSWKRLAAWLIDGGWLRLRHTIDTYGVKGRNFTVCCLTVGRN
jgi:hypothetical protein